MSAPDVTPRGSTEAPAPAPSGQPTSARLLDCLALASPWLATAALLGAGFACRWNAEDAFIDFRVVQNLLAGNGPLYNLSERVEAYSNPLWVGLLAAVWGPLRLLTGGRLSLEWVAVPLGLLLTGGAMVMAALGARRVWRLAGSTGRLWALGLFLFAALPVEWDFVTSGLETSMTIAWLAGSFWLLARDVAAAVEDRRAPRPSTALLIGLGPLVRPDLALTSACFLALLLWNARPRRPRLLLRLVAAAAVVPVAYQIFRMGYFAVLVPNTALAKEAALARWDQGWTYVRDFADPYLLWIPLAVVLQWLAAAAWRSLRERRRAAAALLVAPVLGALLQGLYVARVGGDFMHGRMLLPAAFAFFMPAALVPEGAFAALAPLLLPWAVVSAAVLRVPYLSAGFGPNGIAEERAVYLGYSKTPHPVMARDYAPWDSWDWRWLRRHAGFQPAPGTALYSISGDQRDVPLHVQPWVHATIIAPRANVGVRAYWAGLDVDVVDIIGGVADPITARIRVYGRGRPGHEKRPSTEWLQARCFEPPYVGSPPGGFYPHETPRLEAARRALGCGDLAELLRAIQDPLTLRRFWRNLLDSVRLTRLRIPDDPFQAAREQCGGP